MTAYLVPHSRLSQRYKVEQYLEQCLQSVVDQDLKDIEIIAIDNGSPDKCGNIIALWPQ